MLSKLPVEYQLSPTNNRVRFLDSDGTLYGFEVAESRNLVKSNDWGATWSAVYTFESGIEQVGKAKENLVVALSGGKIFCSQDEGTTFTETFQMTQGSAFRDFGFHTYDKIVLVGSYGSNLSPEVYLSKDCGETWNTILQLPEQYTHIHDVKFDPYEHLVWVTTGDGGPDDMIFWSDDYGKNWRKLENKIFMRTTQVMPLAECVLFGSDEYEEQSIYKHVRPKRGTWGVEVKPEKVFFPKKDFPGNNMTWATNAAITYGEESKAYFGFVQSRHNVRVPSVVWETDGIRFRPIWIEEKLPESDTLSSVGIGGVWGPDENGHLAVDLLSERDGFSHHLLKIKLTQ